MNRPRILVLERSGASSRCVRDAGGDSISVEPWDLEKVDDFLNEGAIDGLLLTGGGDVDPRLYGVKRPHKRVYGVDEERDVVELVALDRAYELDIPVLGICRGSQIMNVWANGTLVQHVGGHAGGEHPVAAFKGTNLRRAFGERMARVVSLHHQVVGEPGQGFRVVAKSHDGHPEAIESTDGRMMGVQFHPEMASSRAYARGIFRWLVEEAGARAGLELEPTPVKSNARGRQLVHAGNYEWEPTPQLALNSGPSLIEIHGAQATKKAAKVVNVKVTFFCPGCRSGGRNLVFDERQDLLDHMTTIHGEIPETWL